MTTDQPKTTAFASLVGRSPSWVQEEIGRTKEYLRALHALQNGELRINRLPPEILTLIFLWIASVTESTGSNRWIYVSHVCSWWRAIALRSQALWTSVRSTNHIDMTSACLERSGTALLRVLYGDLFRQLTHQQWSLFARCIRGHASRFRSLEIDCQWATVIYFTTSVTASMSKLQDLSIIFSHYGVSPPAVPFDIQYASQIPPLRSLTLDVALLPDWNLPLFRGLRELHLSGITSKLSTSQFLDMLNACRHLLEILSLHNAGPSPKDRDSLPRRTVHLASLRQLTVSHRTRDTIPYILSLIELSGSASLVATCIPHYGDPYVGGQDVKGVRTVLPEDTSLLLKLEDLNGLEVTVEYHSVYQKQTHRAQHKSGIMLRGYIGSSKLIKATEARFALGLPFLDDTIRNEEYHQSIYRVIKEVPSVFARSPLQRLHLIVPERPIFSRTLMTQDNWLSIFTTFTLLKDLEIANLSGPQDELFSGRRSLCATSTIVLNLLSPKPVEDHPDFLRVTSAHEEGLLLPHLQLLHFCSDVSWNDASVITRAWKFLAARSTTTRGPITLKILDEEWGLAKVARCKALFEASEAQAPAVERVD
ncbi:hypothetical protein EIP91_000055 [Steccherinum ochraceum]|uniref:F-box domain-containing protein n=1 Tax=Steccherinum ochraceum TaxID=92696 RepID=A0A4R0RVY8_9APHY|nr:hypothetical protein EIP91_000055 [Steccherinum ochraceum]